MSYSASYTFNLPNTFYVALREKLEEMRVQENNLYRERSQSGLYTGLFASLNTPPDYERYEIETIPSPEALKKLVETTYWASMEREEERPLRFCISYAKPHDLYELNLCFKRKIPFTEREVVKLAPSINLSSNIAVWCEGKDKLYIWGRTTFSTDPLALRAIDPGKIVIQLGRKNIAVVSLGKASFLSDTLGSRYSKVWDKLGRNKPEGEYDEFLHEKISALASAIKSMRSLGHGGTLIIIPPNTNCEKSISSIAYESQSTHSRLSFCLNELRTNEADYKEKDQWRSLAEASAQEIAELTTVDGATILTPDFGIIGYGAKLQPASSAAETISLTEKEPFPRLSQENQIPLEKIGGMRHQSAARFVYDNKEAIAIVVSQDSTVTCFAWVKWIDEEQTLMAIRKLEISLL